MEHSRRFSLQMLVRLGNSSPQAPIEWIKGKMYYFNVLLYTKLYHFDLKLSYVLIARPKPKFMVQLCIWLMTSLTKKF